MTKQELEKAIEKGESVWCALLGRVEELKDLKFVGDLLRGYNKIDRFYHNITSEFFDGLYKTKAEAEHYLNHANITRTEQLPFYTFSEIAKDEKNFKMGKTYTLIEDKNFFLDINKSYVSQIVLYTGKEKYSWNFNEENFYKAYDECVRRFKGEE